MCSLSLEMEPIPGIPSLMIVIIALCSLHKIYASEDFNLFEQNSEQVLNEAVSRQRRQATTKPQPTNDPRCSGQANVGICKPSLVKHKDSAKDLSCKKYLDKIYNSFCTTQHQVTDAGDFCPFLCPAMDCLEIFSNTNCSSASTDGFYFDKKTLTCTPTSQLDCAASSGNFFKSNEACIGTCLVTKETDCNPVCQNGGKCINGSAIVEQCILVLIVA